MDERDYHRPHLLSGETTVDILNLKDLGGGIQIVVINAVKLLHPCIKIDLDLFNVLQPLGRKDARYIKKITSNKIQSTGTVGK